MRPQSTLNFKSTSNFLSNSTNQTIEPKINSNSITSNQSLITKPEDTLSLSSEAIDAFLNSEAERLGSSITTVKQTRKTISINSESLENSITKITGSKNTIKDSLNNDILHVKGTTNSLTHQSGNDTIVVEGASNTINLSDLVAEIAILGDHNQVAGNENAKINIAINGNTNQVKSGSLADTILAYGDRNRIDSDEQDDLIISNGYANIIEAGAGDDFVVAKGTSQSIDTGSGNDIVSIEGTGSLYTRAGNDVIEINGSQISAYAGLGDDIISIETANNQVYSQEGDDNFFVNLKSGSLTLDGGKGTDTLNLNFNTDDAAVIVKGNSFKFYFDDKTSLELNLSNTEKVRFKDEKEFSVDQLKEFKGNETIIEPDFNSSVLRNTTASVNVAKLNFSNENLISGSKTTSGIKVNFYDEDGRQKSLQLIGFDYLKTQYGTYLNIEENGDFLNINHNPKDIFILSDDVSNNKTSIKIYDKNSEELLQTNLVNKNSSVLFNDEYIYTVSDLKKIFTGKTEEINTTDQASFESNEALTNVAKINLSADQILKIEPVGSDRFNIVYLNESTESNLELKNVSFLETQEGSKINLNEYKQALSEIRKNEKSREEYFTPHRNTEFKRISYNLTGNTQFLEPLIGGGYDFLTEEEKTNIKNNASELKNSIDFTTNRSTKPVDEASKDLLTLRISNLLRINNATFQELKNKGFELSLSNNRDLGGDSTGYVTGFAEYSGDPDNPGFKVTLTFSTFYGGVYDGQDGDNVDIHEITHLLDYLNTDDSGLPFEINSETGSKYIDARDELFDTYSKTRDDVGAIRTYGFSDVNEFLSVSTEAFYETPDDLLTTSKQLYDALKSYFES